MSPTSAAVLAGATSGGHHIAGHLPTGTGLVMLVGGLVGAALLAIHHFWSDRNFWKAESARQASQIQRMYEDMHRADGFFSSHATANSSAIAGTWLSKPGMPGVPVGTAPGSIVSEEDKP